MLITCKCLNVSISEVNGALVGLKTEDLQLSCLEQRDPFFQEVLCAAVNGHVAVRCSGLLQARVVGAWLVRQCLVCHAHTHASNMHDAHKLLINMALVTSEEAIASLKRSENYSPAFQIVLFSNGLSNEELSMLPNAPAVVNHPHPTTTALNQRLADAIQTEADAVEEAVRIFREKKSQEFEEFRERAHRDHKILTMLLNAAEKAGVGLTNSSNTKSAGQTNAEDPASRHTHRSKNTNLSNTHKSKHGNTKSLVTEGTYKEDSLDSEGIFDLEGMDSSPPANSDQQSDAYGYDSDTDDSVSRDEGIHIGGAGGGAGGAGWGAALAKSLPVNVPAFAQFVQDGVEHGDQEDDPQDIAASIQALARSVHGDVFGDLPRPRFSTQI